MTAIADAAARVVGTDHVLTGAAAAPYLHDATEVRGLAGSAGAVALPADVEQVRALVEWCYANEVAVVPRGAGTGYAGGAVPQGGLVLALDRLDAVRSIDPLQWRMCVEAGVTTARVQRLARENGLMYPPNPGAGEQSHIGGNIATNAGGPRAFKYGVTGHWVTGLEAVMAPGRVVHFGGPLRKDVAGYDVAALLVGSEGTLGIVTAAWLRLMPAVEAAWPVVATYPDSQTGSTAVMAAMASGTVASLIEYLDGRCIEIAGDAARGVGIQLPRDARFLVIAEADGSRDEAIRARELLREALAEGSTWISTPDDPTRIEALWRWRDGVSIAVNGWRGGKISEDIGVPVERLGDAVEATIEIGERHELDACSWGHAGDGNLHSNFLFDRADRAAIARAEAAAEDLFALAVELGGTVSGEHGIGLVKSGQLRRQWDEATVAVAREIKRALDPKGLLNPGKKLA